MWLRVQRAVLLSQVLRGEERQLCSRQLFPTVAGQGWSRPKHSGAVLFTKIYAVPVFCQAQSRRRWEAIGQIGVSLDGGRLPCLKHCALMSRATQGALRHLEKNRGEVGLCDSGEVT